MYAELVALYCYSYMAGAIPTPYLIAKLVKGIDLRQYGSGNVGGSNVVRQMGKKWFVPLAVIEFLLKGLSPAFLGMALLSQESDTQRAQSLLLIAPLLALVGNNWSAFLRFKGGRGLMVVCGMLIALVPLLFATAITVYLIGWRLTHSSAIWALVALALLPVLALMPGGVFLTDWPNLVEMLQQGSLSEFRVYDPVAIGWFCGAIVGLVLLKRILSNSMIFPEEMSRKKVLFNRFLLDRDVSDRAEWVERIPE